MDDVEVPAGWPAQVRPPGDPRHVRTAVGWLLEQCPSEYRAHRALTSQPAVLAWLAQLHVQAQQRANVEARAAARAQLRDVLDPRAVQALLDTLDVEQARLLGAHRAVQLVAATLTPPPAQRSDATSDPTQGT